MDRNNKLRILSLVLFVTSFFLNGCLPEKEQAPYPYKIELNPLRKEVGLRIIDSTFSEGRRYGYKSMSTYNETFKRYSYNINLKLKKQFQKPKTEPHYSKKHIHLNRYNGKPQYEEDIYRSGFSKYGYNEETDVFETLKYRYIFEEYKDVEVKTKDSVIVYKGWEYIYEFPIEM